MGVPFLPRLSPKRGGLHLRIAEHVVDADIVWSRYGSSN
jgi:hypothetical protein